MTIMQNKKQAKANEKQTMAPIRFFLKMAPTPAPMAVTDASQISHRTPNGKKMSCLSAGIMTPGSPIAKNVIASSKSVRPN